jgi:hypothetical protein
MTTRIGTESTAGERAIGRSTMSGQVKQSWVTWLSTLAATLAFAATTAGIFTAFGHTHRTFISLRGEIVTIQGGGLYANESSSMAAQGVGMDLVTLLVAIPLLLVTTFLANRASLRGRLLQVGAFFYFTTLTWLFCLGSPSTPSSSSTWFSFRPASPG